MFGVSVVATGDPLSAEGIKSSSDKCVAVGSLDNGVQNFTCSGFPAGTLATVEFTAQTDAAGV